MSIVQCRMCRKPFHSVSGMICSECSRQVDKDFMTVRDYIYDNRHASIDKTSEETGVKKSVILHLLKEGRLMLDNPDSEGLLRCDVCRKPINTGRMCKECNEKVASTMSRSIETGKPPKPEKKDRIATKNTAKMHTDDMRKR